MNNIYFKTPERYDVKAVDDVFFRHFSTCAIIDVYICVCVYVCVCLDVSDEHQPRGMALATFENSQRPQFFCCLLKHTSNK